MHPIAGRLSLLPSRRGADGPLAGWRAGGIASLWAVATTLVPIVLLVLVGWLASGLIGGMADPVRLGVDVWLSAHGVPLEVAAGTLTVRPLGLTVVVLAVLWRGGRWAGRSAAPPTFKAAGRLTAWLAVGYAAAATSLALAGAGPAARPDLVISAAAALVLAALVGGLGVLSGAALLPAARGRLGLLGRVALDAGLAAGLVLVGLAAVLLAGVLAVRRESAYDLAAAVGPDSTGWPLLLLLNVLLVPNAVLAAMAFATGPGFAVGVGTSVSIGGSQLGAMPPVSLFAAVPGATEPGPMTYAVLAIPLLAGIAAGLVAVRRSRTLRPELCALAGLGSGVVAGVLALLGSWAASGGFGTGQLAMVGPTAWLVGAAVTAEVGLIAAATAWVGCPRGRQAAVDPASELTAVIAAPVAVAVAATVEASPVVAVAEPVAVAAAAPAEVPPAAVEPSQRHEPDDGEDTVVLEREAG